MLRRAAAIVAAIGLASCGGHAHKTAHKPARLTPICPQAANGHGSLGVCAPKTKLGLTAPHLVPGPIYPDRSNNDPCYCGAQIKAAGQVGLIVKANQGVGFVDQTAVGMVASARAAGLAVGEYDFDQDYTVGEARLFVARLHAAGIYPSTPNTFPAYLDVEYGQFSYGGLAAQIAYLRSQGYRVGIYTGQWYWGPHAGCQWPSGVSAWLSGYPVAPVPCGTQNYSAHQFTSTPVDLSVFLGSLAQFHRFVNATPKPAPQPNRFALFVDGRFPSPWGDLSERLVVERYFGAYEHRAKYRGYLRGLLAAELGWLAARDAYVALHVYHSWKPFLIGSRRAWLSNYATKARTA